MFLSLRADTRSLVARSVIDDCQQGNLRVPGIEGWRYSEVGADKVASGLVVVVRRTTGLVYAVIYPLFMNGFEQCRFD
jgi:hypothetical protein